jgi:hypothetical protein
MENVGILIKLSVPLCTDSNSSEKKYHCHMFQNNAVKLDIEVLKLVFTKY